MNSSSTLSVSSTSGAPSSSTGPAAGATEADVRRVVDCLSATLTGGTIEVSQTGGADDAPVSG